MKRLIYSFFILFIAFSVFSCGGSSSTNATEDKEDVKNDGENKSNSFNAVSVVKIPINEEGTRGELFTIKQGDDFIMFDNQEDYSKFCPELVVRKNVLFEWVHRKHKKTGEWPSKDERISMLRQIPNLISQYVNDKGSINDPIIYEALDRVFFKIDNDISNLNFGIEKKLYDKQHYKEYTGHSGAVLIFKFDSGSDGYISGGNAETVNGETIPDGAVIIMVPVGLY